MKPRTAFVRKQARKLIEIYNIKEPPVDIKFILQKEGIEYQEVDYFPDDVDALIIPFEGRMIAAVNKNQHTNRQRFSLAHELCHFLLHQDRSVLEERITIDSPPLRDEFHGKDVYESEADSFANELLVPLPFLKEVYKDGMTALDLAQVFQVSEHVTSISVTTHFTALFK